MTAADVFCQTLTENLQSWFGNRIITDNVGALMIMGGVVGLQYVAGILRIFFMDGFSHARCCDCIIGRRE